MSLSGGSRRPRKVARATGYHSASRFAASHRLIRIHSNRAARGPVTNANVRILDSGDPIRVVARAPNMLMRSFAARAGKDHALLLLAPGWVKTQMGGPDAKFSVGEVIHEIVDTIVAQE